MSEQNTAWYLEALTHELEQLQGNRFTGNIEFQLNFKDGEIANMNVILRKSIKNI